MLKECDPQMVEALVKGATLGMTHEVVSNYTTQHEVMAAAFTFLDRTLRSVRKLQSDEERFETAHEVAKVLNDMLVDHGKVPS